MDTIRYQNGANLVTEKLFKTRRKTYRLADIEKITLRRPFFMVAIPLGAASYGLTQEYGRYLYQYEVWGCVAMFTVVPIVAWFIGTLSVTSKSLTNDVAAIGFFPVLKQVREAIEGVIYTRAYYPDLIDSDQG